MSANWLVANSLGELPDNEDDFKESQRTPAKCPKCTMTLSLMHDEHGMYFKCNHCKWDSAGLYKTKNKYG